MPVRNLGDQTFAHQGASAQTGHFGVGPAFIHEHELGGGFPCQAFVPARPLFGHVGTPLLAGVQRFFYSSTPAAVAISPSLKFQTGDPFAPQTPPGWYRAFRSAVRSGLRPQR